MSAADLMAVLLDRYLRYDTGDPHALATVLEVFARRRIGLRPARLPAGARRVARRGYLRAPGGPASARRGYPLAPARVRCRSGR
jgi:hypothetical protein